jgi:hypothetical protein
VQLPSKIRHHFLPQNREMVHSIRMQTLVIDAHKVITRLHQKGFTKDQAEALVSAAQEIDLSNTSVEKSTNRPGNSYFSWQRKRP